MSLRKAYMIGRCAGFSAKGYSSIVTGVRLGVSRGRVCELLTYIPKMEADDTPAELKAEYEDGKLGKRDGEYKVGYWGKQR